MNKFALFALISILFVPSWSIEAFGVGTHFNESKHWHHLKEIGVQWIRIDMSWNDIERSQGVTNYAQFKEPLQLANSLGLKTLGIIGYVPEWASCGPASHFPVRQEFEKRWFEYVDSLMIQFGSKVNVWEIWNEPDHKHFFRTQEGCDGWNSSFSEDQNRFSSYVQMQVKTIRYIRSKYKNITLISSGLSIGGDSDPKFVDRLISDQPKLWNEWMALNIHGYGYPSNSSINKRIEIAQKFKRLYPKKQVWFTEHGVTSFRKNSISVQDAGAFLVRNYAKALSGGMDKVFWFRLIPGGDYANLLDKSGNPTEFLWIYKRLIQHWSKVTHIQPWEHDGAIGAIGLLPDGKKALIAWTDGDLRTIDFPHVLSIRDLFGNPIEANSIHLNSSPLFILLDN